MSRRKRTCPPEATIAVLAEGGDEERLVQRFLGEGHFSIVAGGQSGFVETAAAAAKDPGWTRIRSVAVVLDAEEDPAGAFERACAALRAMGWPTPARAGAVETRGDQRVGVYVLPDNGSTGASETLLLQTATEAERACIASFLDCTGNPGTTRARRDKAAAHALAASRGEGRPDQLWSRVDPDHPALSALRAFLLAL